VSKRGYFLTPDGERIIGTLETVEARAELDENGVELKDDGSYEPHQEGSEIFYDSMRTQERDGKLLYLDVQGRTWTDDQLTFVEVNEQARGKLDLPGG